jgi:hypothetical protein
VRAWEREREREKERARARERERERERERACEYHSGAWVYACEYHRGAFEHHPDAQVSLSTRLCVYLLLLLLTLIQ